MLKALTVEVTGSCSYSCIYCYEKGKSAKEKIELEEFVELVKAASRLGVSDLFLSGGEPLLHERIYDLVEVCLDSRIYVSIFTSCPENSHRTIERLARFPNLAQIRVSLESLQPEVLEFLRKDRCAYRNVMKAVDTLSELKAVFGISMTANEINLHEIGDLLDFAAIKGAAYFRAAPLMNGNASLNRKNAESLLTFLLEAAIERLESLRISVIPVSCDPKLSAWLFDCPCPAFSHTAYLYKKNGILFIAPCAYSRKISEPVLIDDLAGTIERLRNRLGRKTTSENCLSVNSDGSSFLKELFFRAAAILAESGKSARSRMLLSGIVNRQLEIYNFGFFPCWRSSPLFLYPLKPSHAWA